MHLDHPAGYLVRVLEVIADRYAEEPALDHTFCLLHGVHRDDRTHRETAREILCASYLRPSTVPEDLARYVTGYATTTELPEEAA